MKAHIKSPYEKEREFIREHINRVIKLFGISNGLWNTKK